jgi:hypothetical protein
MSDLTAGPPSGERAADSAAGSGGPPPVLLAALFAALLIAAGVIAAFASLGGDDSGQADAGGRTRTSTTTADKRVLLTVSVAGTGIGRVEITRSDVSCNAACEYKFTAGARVTATAKPSSGSTFEGWSGACTGKRCSIVMDRRRSLTATFAAEPVAAPKCDGVPAEERDPACPPEDTTTTPVEPGPDCQDGIDNDDDGLTDTAQDPDCETTGSEAGGTAPPATATPPPVAANDCADGKDNDNDGLTDAAQDPNCENGHSESGATVRATPRGTARSRSECSDGRDNDGDGLIDSAQDPGCEANSTEAG